jgi:hypothetical protein
MAEIPTDIEDKVSMLAEAVLATGGYTFETTPRSEAAPAVEGLLEAPDWPWADDYLMSNFDHEVDEKIASELRNNQLRAKYSAWNFHAVCWFADGQYHAEICQYHNHVATLSAPTPEELMEKCCDEYGYS